ncbi:microtubule-associated protein 9 [Echinops telfairi]|uniref:Microtubule-associated protein 9 n=1 Tax=Echinops telfairi TaxID=9371 RepID=A0ABM0ZRW7_ECHTE|nr:microtubule-associated protein 9 [Echinops telfairi]
MSDDIFSTTLAYTKSPKATKRTTFQDELIKAITARSARQRSSEYSDDFDSDEIVSLGDFSDASLDEQHSIKKKLNDFHISDDEEKSSPRLSFLKTNKSSSDIIKGEPVPFMKTDEDTEPDDCGDIVVNSLSAPQDKDQDIGREAERVKPKCRSLPIKSTSSANLFGSENNSLDADAHFKPSPLPRNMLKKNSPREEKEMVGEDKESIVGEELDSPSASYSLPRLNGLLLETEKSSFSEGLDPEEGPSLTSPSSLSLRDNIGGSLSPESGKKTVITGQTEEFTENLHSLKSKENEENSFFMDLVPTAFEKAKQSQVIADSPEGETGEAVLSAEDSFEAIEDRNMKNKKLTNNRASSASPRLMTSAFLKKSSSVRKTSSATTSSHYLGTLKFLDQKPSQKQNMEPNKADDIRAAIYQDWLEKKNVYLHELHRIKRIESENLRIQDEQKRAAKREEALASFEAWKAMKEKGAKKTAAKKRLEAKNKKNTEEENAVRKGEALQAFEKWKEKKMEYLKEKSRKAKEYERAKKQKEEESVAEKKKDNLIAVEKWNERKDVLFKQKEKEKINEKKKEDLKRAEKRDKDKQALDEYERWLEKKEKQERIERKPKKCQSILENEALPSWTPTSRAGSSKVF